MGISRSKHFDSIAWSITAIMLVITLVFMNGASFGITVAAHTMGYENRLFDNTRVHTIDIVMNDWDEFIDNATSEEYHAASLVIDGEAYKNVAIRGKGNTSLSTVSSLGSERYSFKVEFDHYDNSISYHGLDKLSLNNLIQDTTMMKDYLTYTMMAEFGAVTPLCSYAYLTVNGEDWGLYLAVEGVEDSFLTRNWGTNAGELYKPDSLSFGGGRGNGKDFDMGDFDFSFGGSTEDGTTENDGSSTDSTFDPSTMFGGGNFDPSTMFGEDFDASAFADGNFDPSTMFGGGEMPDMSQIPSRGDSGDAETGDGEGDKSSRPSGGFDMGGMFGGFGMGSSDVKLQYIDDNASSYSNIWNNAKTDISTADQNRLIASLKQLSSYQNVNQVVDIDAVLRYFVVHNYVCNGDSYTGSMIHNYYLYEENGQLSMIPWDYNLAYGTFQGGNAQSTVNTPIDTPTSGDGSDRPMWYWIVSDEKYLAQYHQYYEEFLNTVDIAGIIENAYNLIKDYVAKDPTAFFTYEEFETGVDAMRRFCALRTESITAQLANGETAQTMDYADASDLNTSDMGSMSGMGGGKMPGGDFGGSRGDRGSRDEAPEGSAETEAAETEAAPMVFYNNTVDTSMTLGAVNTTGGIISLASGNNGGFTFGGGQTPPEGFDPGSMPEGGFSFGGGEMPEGFDPSTIPGGGSFPGSTMPGGTTQDGSAAGNTGDSGTNSEQTPSSSRMPSGMGGFSSSGISAGNLILTGVSILVLAIGLIIAKKYPA